MAPDSASIVKTDMSVGVGEELPRAGVKAGLPREAWFGQGQSDGQAQLGGGGMAMGMGVGMATRVSESRWQGQEAALWDLEKETPTSRSACTVAMSISPC